MDTMKELLFFTKKSLRSLRPEADLREGSLRLCGELNFYVICYLSRAFGMGSGFRARSKIKCYSSRSDLWLDLVGPIEQNRRNNWLF